MLDPRRQRHCIRTADDVANGDIVVGAVEILSIGNLPDPFHVSTLGAVVAVRCGVIMDTGCILVVDVFFQMINTFVVCVPHSGRVLRIRGAGVVVVEPDEICDGGAIDLGYFDPNQ